MKKGAKRSAYIRGRHIAGSELGAARTPGTRVNELAIGRGLIEVRLE